MSFLNPILLAGLAAIAVPIIIHLLHRRKFQKIVWAAMRFLQAAVERNQRRMRIEDMILLALRCLLVALLALALARPALLSQAAGVFGQSKVTGVIILDHSRSMGVSDGTGTRFDRARQAAEQVLDSLPAGSAMAVFLASDRVQAVIPEPTFDLNLARKTVREAPLTDRATDLFPALQRALATLKERLAVRKEVYLITDGQSAGWRQLAEIQAALERAKTEAAAHIILVNEHEPNNLGVSELRHAGGLSPVNQPLRFEAKVTNYGRDEARNTRLSLSVNGEPPSDEFAVDALPPGATKNVTFFTKLRAPGFHAITVRLPEDRLRADDGRTVAVRAIPEVKVLLVDGEPGSEPRDSEAYFLQHALVPVPADQAPNYFIKATTVTSGELAQSRLDDFDAVILANVADVSESTLKALESYLRRGGGLMIFPGERVITDFYNRQLFQRLQMLPATFGAPRGDAQQDDKFLTLQAKDYEHPIAALWNDTGAGQLASVRFFKSLELKPASDTNAVSPDAGSAQIVLKFADGTPAVMERTWGLGRVVQFSSTADTAWNDLPVRPSWVPLLHRALGSLVLRQDEGLNLRVGDKFAWRVGQEFLDKDATFFKPRPGEVARDLRHIDLINGRPLLRYEETDFAGLYDVAVSEPALAMKFAAQADAGESSLEELSSAQLTTLKDVANVVTWTPEMSLRTFAQKSRSGLEFWFPVLIAALVVALVETVLAQWFSRSK